MMGYGDFLVWIHMNWTGFNVSRLHMPCFWAGWSCHSFALEMKTHPFNCNALICERSQGKKGQRFPLSSFEGFSFEVALLIDPNPLSSREWGWVGVNAQMGVIPGRLRSVVQVQSCSLTRVRAEQQFTAPLSPCSSLRTEFFSQVWRSTIQTVLSSLTRCLWEKEYVSRVTTATTCKNAA